MLNHRFFARVLSSERLRLDDRGVTAIEYSLIALFIAMAIVAAVGALGTTVLGLYTSVVNAFP